MEVLERFFDAMQRHDWERLASCLADDVLRTGPFLDVVRGKKAYVDFLAGVIPSLPNYSLAISSIHAFDATSALVKLSETLDVNGISTEFPEVLLFDFDEGGRIRCVDVYVKQVPAVLEAGAQSG